MPDRRLAPALLAPALALALALGLAACAGPTSPSVLARLNCSNISQPGRETNYLQCMQQWMNTNAPVPGGTDAPAQTGR